ncbi:hypothetical protein ACR3K2_10050 [Cryptosporidium serpentis]
MGYIYYDLVVNLPIMWSLTHCKTKKSLASYKPETSLISLNSLYTVGSTFSVFVILYYLILFKASRQSWFTPSYTRNLGISIYDIPIQDVFGPAIIWLWLYLLHSHMSVVFGFGRDYREPFYKNKSFLFNWSMAQLGLLWFTFSPPNSINCWFKVNCTNEILNNFSFGNIYNKTFIKFDALTGHNLFALSWKFEFTLWVAVATFLMGLSYYFNSRGYKARLKKRI